MQDIINKNIIIKNAVVSSILGILIPFILLSTLSLFVPQSIIESILISNLLLSNGIIFIIVYTSFGIFKKHTFPRLLIGITYIIIVIYFYFVGSNFFTLYLPHSNFAEFNISITYDVFDFEFVFNYLWVVVLLLILKSINLVRHYLKGENEKFFSFRKKAKEKKITYLEF